MTAVQIIREKIKMIEGELETLKRMVSREPDFEIDEKNWQSVKPGLKKIRRDVFARTYGKKK